MMMNGVIYGSLFLGLGLVSWAIFYKLVYPVISRNYEEAKVTGTQSGLSPNTLSNLVKLTDLILLPAMGFWVGYSQLPPIWE